MRIVFFGTPELAVPSLEAVANHHDVVAVVCQPDRPKGRGKKMLAPPVKEWAVARGIETVQPTRLNDGTFETWLKGCLPDVCVIAAYGRILKQRILDVPPLGFINMHPSLLPKYRGPSPITSAILNGDEVTGVSIMRLSMEMDAGDVMLCEEVAILPDENAVSLTNRLSRKGGEMLVRALSLIAAGEAKFTPQDPAQATYCRLLDKADGQIRWTEPASSIHNLVRAAVPWPVAHCLYKGEVCRIHATRLIDEPCSEAPGVVMRVESDKVVVATGQGAIAITEFQAPGKRAMAMSDYLRGHAILPGERFEEL